MRQWAPISRDPDPISRRRRLRMVRRDLELHKSGQACTRCGHMSYQGGGQGCACPTVSAQELADRCAAIARGECFCGWWVEGVS